MFITQCNSLGNALAIHELLVVGINYCIVPVLIFEFVIELYLCGVLIIIGNLV